PAMRSPKTVLPAPGVATARKSRGLVARYLVRARRCQARSGRAVASWAGSGATNASWDKPSSSQARARHGRNITRQTDEDPHGPVPSVMTGSEAPARRPSSSTGLSSACVRAPERAYLGPVRDGPGGHAENVTEPKWLEWSMLDSL